MSWNTRGISLQLQRPDLFWLKRCHRLSCPCLCRLDAFDFLCSHKLFFSAAAERESFSDPQRVTLLKKGRSCCHRKAFLTPWLRLRQPQDSVTLAPIRASYTSSHFLTKKKKKTIKEMKLPHAIKLDRRRKCYTVEAMVPEGQHSIQEQEGDGVQGVHDPTSSHHFCLVSVSGCVHWEGDGGLFWSWVLYTPWGARPQSIRCPLVPNSMEEQQMIMASHCTMGGSD